MKKIPIISIVLMSLVLFGSFLFGRSAPASVISIHNISNEQKEAEYVVDFGLIEDFKVKTRQIPIINGLDAPIELNKIKSSCGCASIQMPTTVSPHSTDSITLIFNPRGYKGIVKQTVDLKVDPSEYSKISFHVRADVQPLFDYNPKILTFPKNPTQNLTQNVIVKLFKRKSIFIHKIENPPDYVVSIKEGDVIFDKSIVKIEKTAFKNDAKITKDSKQIVITGDEKEEIIIDIAETNENYFKIEPPAIHVIVSKSVAINEKVFFVSPLFINNSTQPIVCEIDNPLIRLETVKPLTIDSSGSVTSPQVMKIIANADMISSSTQIPFRIHQNELEQNALIWVTKLN